MINNSVLFQRAHVSELDTSIQQPNKEIQQIVADLYQVDVYQPLIDVQKQVLQLVAVGIDIEVILWQTVKKNQSVDSRTVLQEHNLVGEKMTLFDISLDDSNIHHTFFVAFIPALSGPDISSNSQYFTTLLPLIAEVYRQTLIHSYYREWQSLPFKKHHQLVTQAESVIASLSLPIVDSEPLYETWKETMELNQSVLVRVKRVENQLFIDKFLMPNAIDKLTFKQKQICFFLKACCSNQQIAENLSISIKTVGNHLAAIYEKLAVSRAELFQLLNAVDET